MDPADACVSRPAARVTWRVVDQSRSILSCSRGTRSPWSASSSPRASPTPRRSSRPSDSAFTYASCSASAASPLDRGAGAAAPRAPAKSALRSAASAPWPRHAAAAASRRSPGAAAAGGGGGAAGLGSAVNLLRSHPDQVMFATTRRDLSMTYWLLSATTSARCRASPCSPRRVSADRPFS